MKTFKFTSDMAHGSRGSSIRTMVHSVHQSSIAKEPMLMMCNRCKQVIMRIPKGEMTFGLIRGPCDCCWRCCTPLGDHAPHIINVPDDGTVKETLQEMRSRMLHLCSHRGTMCVQLK